MTSEKRKEIVLAALGMWRSDDFERAKQAFGSLTTKEMQQQHGQSGKTRQEIFDAYKQHVDNYEEVKAAVLRAEF